jgi:hypothetical protein
MFGTSFISAGRLDPARMAPAGDDRRAHPRYPEHCVTSCSIIHLPETIQATVRIQDISMGGIGLVSPTPLRPGTFLAIALRRRGKAPCTLKAQVVRVVAQKRGTFVLGCRLSPTLSADEFAALR